MKSASIKFNEFYEIAPPNVNMFGQDEMKDFRGLCKVYYCTPDRMKILVRECFDRRAEIAFVSFTISPIGNPKHSFEGCKLSSWSYNPQNINDSVISFTIDNVFNSVKLGDITRLMATV